MNIKEINKIKDYIKKHPKHFDIKSFIDTERCTACFSGLALVLKQEGRSFKEKLENADRVFNRETESAKILDLHSNQFEVLTYGDKSCERLWKFDKLTKKQKIMLAVRRLNKFIKSNGTI